MVESRNGDLGGMGEADLATESTRVSPSRPALEIPAPAMKSPHQHLNLGAGTVATARLAPPSAHSPAPSPEPFPPDPPPESFPP